MMKGVILAGGKGVRLLPCTKVINKQLLPVYDKPMIYYPLETLSNGGIQEILIISGKGHAGDFLELLGDGHEFRVKLSYSVQEYPGGNAQALGLAENFAAGGKIVVISGDNILEDNIKTYVEDFEKQREGAKLFLKEISGPGWYGVAEIKNGKIINIKGKFLEAQGNLAVTGLYMYNNQIFDIIKTLKPSKKGEIGLADANRFYIKKGTATYEILPGFWIDAGNKSESLFKAAEFMRRKKLRLRQSDAGREKK